ncbi:ABC transporter substrate-binding protein [Amylibacter sp. IMCC11727]|uniref:MlaC/ttg2D family ABC transporter substrate-binding protein n=1 Tax=Amylibacter sp. IMCC11727 TaxID=3039851 RepID=UPI00244E5AD9|nr:ABC transporter substrate-binding protein [Amylibacter sp. IMCC11727]WGI21779.1 ABC transporter substrate-binding protein [Amylibacter sp. IMCC11727]
MQTNTFTRRAIMAMLASLPLAGPASALSQQDAESLIGKLTDDIFKVINSGKSESAMFRDFERIFVKYADVPVIARSSLGVARRSASKSELSAYTKAFQGYVSRKYGKRFREFIGATIEVTKSQKSKRGYLVDSNVTFKGKRPFLVQWQVSDASGRDRMFDIIIEGISMLRLEREEIGAMLDRRGGDIGKLIAHLKKAS